MDCPACGQTVETRLIVKPDVRLAVIDGVMFQLSPMQARILEILRRQSGPILSQTIADIIGTTDSSVRVTICYLKQAIYDTKLVIDSKRGKNNGYWLRWLPER